MNTTTEPDHDLLRRFTESGDETSFSKLIGRHGSLVMGVCYRVLGDMHDAEESAQATFIQLAVKARRIDLSKPLAPWLYTVARQKALDSLKSRKRRQLREKIGKEARMADIKY